MKRLQRLQPAKHWLSKYTGKNIIRGYCKHFAVDWFCAIKELEMLGVPLNPDRVAQLKRTVETSRRANRARKLKMKTEEARGLFLYSESDENFAYIAGHTSGGVPFGITWEEWEKMEAGEGAANSRDVRKERIVCGVRSI